MLILLKKPIGIPVAITGIALAIVGWGVAVWVAIRTSSPVTDPAFLAVVASFWAGWLILYGIVVWMAAKKLRWPQTGNRPLIGGKAKQYVCFVMPLVSSCA